MLKQLSTILFAAAVTVWGQNGPVTVTIDAATAWKEMNDMKNVERALIATGVALVISGGAASAAILATSGIAAAAQPTGATQLAS